MLHNIFVCGLAQESTRSRLLTEKDTFTFPRAVEFDNTVESSSSMAKLWSHKILSSILYYTICHYIGLRVTGIHYYKVQNKIHSFLFLIEVGVLIWHSWVVLCIPKFVHFVKLATLPKCVKVVQRLTMIHMLKLINLILLLFIWMAIHLKGTITFLTHIRTTYFSFL